MNKPVRKIACLLLSVLTAFSLFACGGGGGKDEDSSTSVGGTSSDSVNSESSGSGEKEYDTETRPLVLATDMPDGNFNPFFATSAVDSTMASVTQIGMMTTDEKGNVTCGEDEPTVTLQYQTTIAEDESYTDYEFIIKNDIKFSDGEPLTIKDVLFNLYVYLDPSYTGSATMYSTKIVGLQKYREQDPDIKDDADISSNNATFYAEAVQRVNNIINYLDTSVDENFSADEIAQIQSDIVRVKELFKEEVESDWNLNYGSLESYEDDYAFTQNWEVYYLVEGLVTVQTNSATKKPYRDANGKYVTSLTPYGIELEDGSTYTSTMGTYKSELVEEINEAATDEALLNVYIEEGATEAEARDNVIRDTAINTVYSAYARDSYVPDILSAWATGTNILDEFTAEERTKFFDSKKNEDGSLLVESISGITTYKTETDFNNQDLGESHDVLKIRINGIDPKAIFNFSFAVAPMHYYSSQEYIEKADGKTSFGVSFNDNEFFKDVLQDPDKNKFPVGAGAYKATGKFYNNGWIYFERNEYFETVGEELSNAKIKELRYRVVTSDNIMYHLEAKSIDIGQPNATATNITNLSNMSHINATTVRTNGYGYVGINPKYVPDIEVRQAIMYVLDRYLDECLTYYTEANAELLYRGMSKESWVWDYVDEDNLPEGIDKNPNESYYDGVDYQGTGNSISKSDIQELVGKADWQLSGGKLTKNGKTLKLTFTIAGSTDDHPAYSLFTKAAAFLNGCGFDVTVATDINALKKLATGGLEVWAAAWSSSVDPDMYQVFHKGSTATSVQNWGYPTILNDSTDQFIQEKNIINSLSTLIEEGRKTNNQSERADIYIKALDKVMQLAVEFPTYQRKDCVAYNKNVVNPKSLNLEPTAFSGVIDRLWEIDYN